MYDAVFHAELLLLGKLVFCDPAQPDLAGLGDQDAAVFASLFSNTLMTAIVFLDASFGICKGILSDPHVSSLASVCDRGLSSRRYCVI